MTVKELIDLLRELPQDAEISMESYSMEESSAVLVVTKSSSNITQTIDEDWKVTESLNNYRVTYWKGERYKAIQGTLNSLAGWYTMDSAKAFASSLEADGYHTSIS